MPNKPSIWACDTRSARALRSLASIAVLAILDIALHKWSYQQDDTLLPQMDATFANLGM